MRILLQGNKKRLTNILVSAFLLACLGLPASAVSMEEVPYLSYTRDDIGPMVYDMQPVVYSAYFIRRYDCSRV